MMQYNDELETTSYMSRTTSIARETVKTSSKRLLLARLYKSFEEFALQPEVLLYS